MRFKLTSGIEKVSFDDLSESEKDAVLKGRRECANIRACLISLLHLSFWRIFRHAALISP